jgi:zinc transporter, ZIP family
VRDLLSCWFDRRERSPGPAIGPTFGASFVSHSRFLVWRRSLHNFPEGLATFLSTLADPKVGVILAVAIAIHNIPEGLCVAMPVYYATGSRWKAFGWALLSGVSEPLAAVLGWAVLASVFSDVLYATLFGIVAGMMVMISVRELMPTAHRYDPDDSVVTYSFIAGMFIIALSLVLFVV